MKVFLTFLVLISFTVTTRGADKFPTFQPHTIDANVGKVCYAVTAADVDGDSALDIVAVTESRVLWYENPTWVPRVIIDDQTPQDNVCIAPLDIDQDGNVDFALGAGWTKTGTLHWLSRGKSLDEKWQVHSIGREPWLHRMRWADVLGKGRPQLVISPLNATVGDGVRLTAFQIPADPRTDRWQSTILNSDFNRMHNHWHNDFDGDGVVDTITASREGVHLIRRNSEGWFKTKLGAGAQAAKPNLSGAGEIKTGRLKDGMIILATVEPMHGDQLVVYTSPESRASLWKRHVIDKGFKRGHALWLADVDRDGSDEIVFGHSDTPDVPGLNIYDVQNQAGTEWTKHVIDAGGIATEDLIVADFTGDGHLDVVAGGRASHNVKLYVNGR